MKTISVEELHEQTGQFVHLAAHEDVLVTEHGQPLAVMKPVRGVNLPGKPFPRRDPAAMPKAQVETSQYLSEDREGR